MALSVTDSMPESGFLSEREQVLDRYILFPNPNFKIKYKVFLRSKIKSLI